MRTLAEIVRLRGAACREALDAVAMMAAGEDGIEARAGGHVATCLRCQAEVAAYRRVLVTMRSMAADELPVPAGWVEADLALLHAMASDPDFWTEATDQPDVDVESAGSWAVRAAYVGGITASAAGMLMWITRRRIGLATAS